MVVAPDKPFHEYCELTQRIKGMCENSSREAISLRSEIHTTRSALLQWMDLYSLDRVVIPGGDGKVLKRRLHTNRQSITAAILKTAWDKASASPQLKNMLEKEKFARSDALLACFIRSFDEIGLTKFTPYADVIDKGSKADTERHCVESDKQKVPRTLSITRGVPDLVMELAHNLETCKVNLGHLTAKSRDEIRPMKARLHQLGLDVKAALRDKERAEPSVTINIESGADAMVLSIKASRAKPPIGIKAFKRELAPSIVDAILKGREDLIEQREVDDDAMVTAILERIVGEYRTAKMEAKPAELRLTKRRRTTPPPLRGSQSSLAAPSID